MAALSACPGCGLVLPATGRRFDDAPTASTECWELFSELTARIMGEASLLGLFQLRVDTYFAQHPGPETSDLSIAFALIGLDLALERGASGVDVRALHQRLGDAKIAWPHLEPPVDRGSLTVFDVALESSSDRCAGQLRRWAGSVWRSWLPHRATVEGWIERYAS